MAIPVDPDADLMLRIKKGDLKAFEDLMTRHQKAVFNLSYRYVGNAAAAEDLTQDVFLKIYQARLQYKPVAKFKTWMYRIAVNTCLNAIRQRRPTTALPEEDILHGNDSATPGRQSDTHELQAAVRLALQTLPGNQRMAVILTQFEDQSYDHAAEVIGVSVPALKSLIVRAKENLAQQLGKWTE